MTGNLSDTEKQAFEKLAAMVAETNKGPAVFDHDEGVIIREMIRLYEAFKAFGLLAGAAKRIAIWLGIMAGAWLAFEAAVRGWLSGGN